MRNFYPAIAAGKRELGGEGDNTAVAPVEYEKGGMA